MEQMNEKIEGIRRMMESMKGEKYALVNPELVSLEDYVKTLYLKVLCTVVQYENDPSEMQVFYLKRVVSGIGVEDTMEECMRKALEITDTDIREFLSLMKENRVKYYFTLDGLILVSMGSAAQENYEYLAELIELCGVTKDDLDYICLVAKSVLQQQSSFFDEAKNLVNERVRGLDFTPYIQNYYAGAVVDTDTQKHYFAPEKKYSADVQLPHEYKERTVILENLIIKVDKRWEFQGCREVIFKNCEFEGEKNYIIFDSVGRVCVDGCVMKCFSKRVFRIISINELEISNSEFIQCGYKTDKNAYGGVINISGNSVDVIVIKNNCFLNCYVIAEGYHHEARGVLLDFSEKNEVKKFSLIDNKFSGCKAKGTWNCYKEMIYGLNAPNYMEEGNICTGDVTKILG